MEKLKDVLDAVVAGNISETQDTVRQTLDKGTAPVDVINRGLVAGLDVVGEQFANGEKFLPEMMLSAIAAREGIAIATKGMEKSQYKPKATMVLGTVKGDLHDIGKNLVTLVLRSRGFEVIDLGINIPEEQFINAVREHKPELLGLSCLMTTTMIGMKDVINALTEAGLRNTVKVIIGGCPVTQEFASWIGADYCGHDAASTATLLEKSLANIKDKG